MSYDRTETIKHEDEVFAPVKEEQELSDLDRDALMCLPLLGMFCVWAVMEFFFAMSW